jgi:hypothetical protein
MGCFPQIRHPRSFFITVQRQIAQDEARSMNSPQALLQQVLRPLGTCRWHQWQILTPRRARRTEVSCWISRQVAGPRVGWVTRCSRGIYFRIRSGCFLGSKTWRPSLPIAQTFIASSMTGITKAS